MTDAYIPRRLAAPRQSFFLFGARGSGKSTWVRHALPDAHRIDLLDEALYHSLLSNPAAFADELRALPRAEVRPLVPTKRRTQRPPVLLPRLPDARLALR